jgi:hypothetical protein
MILIHKLKNYVNSRPKSVFKDQEAVKCLSSLHDKYVIVLADKASTNIVFVCKSYYFEYINRVNPQTLYQKECLKRS